MLNCGEGAHYNNSALGWVLEGLLSRWWEHINRAKLREHIQGCVGYNFDNLFCMICLKESRVKQGKMFFYFTLKALSVFEIIKFQMS